MELRIHERLLPGLDGLLARAPATRREALRIAFMRSGPLPVGVLLALVLSGAGDPSPGVRTIAAGALALVFLARFGAAFRPAARLALDSRQQGSRP